VVVYSRQTLRRLLGTAHLMDTYVGQVAATTPIVNYSINLLDGALADLSLSGQGLYVGSWVWLSGAEFRVASFNVASGALVSQAATTATIAVQGAEYERHDAVRPSDKNRALDEAIKRLRVRQEVGLQGIDGRTAYPLPASVEQVLGGYYFASPDGTASRGQTRLNAVRVVTTGSGPEVRIDPAIGGSQQLVLDAITTPTLGSAETATVSIPDERLVLYAAEAECWGMLTRDAPVGAMASYRERQNQAALQHARLAARYAVPVDRVLRLDEGPF